MKKAYAVPFLLVGIAVLGLGVYAVDRGFDARAEVRDSLLAREITTPAEASIPNARVDDAATARSMADYISGAVGQATGGREWNEIGRYLAADGSDTDDPAAAALGADGQPTENPLRALAFEASTGTTGLYTSVLGWEIGTMAIGLGVVMLVLGTTLTGGAIAVSGVRIPVLSRRPQLASPAPHHA